MQCVYHGNEGLLKCNSGYTCRVSHRRDCLLSLHLLPSTPYYGTLQIKINAQDRIPSFHGSRFRLHGTHVHRRKRTYYIRYRISEACSLSLFVFLFLCLMMIIMIIRCEEDGLIIDHIKYTAVLSLSLIYFRAPCSIYRSSTGHHLLQYTNAKASIALRLNKSDIELQAALIRIHRERQCLKRKAHSKYPSTDSFGQRLI